MNWNAKKKIYDYKYWLNTDTFIYMINNHIFLTDHTVPYSLVSAYKHSILSG